MTDSILMTERMRRITIGYKLHRAIVAWGQHHDVMAYMVKPAEGRVYFEIFDPRTKEISHTFPARITQAIKRCAREVDEYVAWDRSFDSPPAPARVLLGGRRALRPMDEIMPFASATRASRLASPMKSARQTRLAKSGRVRTRSVQVDFRENNFLRFRRQLTGASAAD